MSAVPHGSMGAIGTSQRYTRAHPCPICLGYESMRRRRGERCAGFLSADGLYARCEHSEYAGGLPLDMRTAPPTHNHYLGGPCKCGATHITGAASPSSAARRKPSPDRGAADRGETRIQGRKPEAVYLYTLADGTPAYKIERWRTVDTATGELGKTFKPYLPDASMSSGWARRSTLGNAPHMPYRLRELADADAARRVWICEGEKCADALAALGELATCNDGGAGKWHRCADVARETLAGRDVVILPDNDGASSTAGGSSGAGYVGQRHALDVAASLADVAASVRVLMLPHLPIKGDVCDWLADGHTIEQLRALADAAPVYDPARPGVWHTVSAEDWRAGGWRAPDGAPIEPEATPEDAAPAPAPGGAAPIELATRRRDGRSSPPGGADRGPTGGDTGEPETGSGLIELGEGLYCDAARTQLYRARRERAGTGASKRGGSAGDEDDGERDGISVEPVRFPAGMPRLLAAYCVGGEPDGDVTELTTYRYEWSNLPDRGPVNATEKDVNSGAIHARTPGLAITSRRDRDFWADVIKAQVIACGIPVGVSQESTGWHQDIVTGRWERHLRDGRIIQRPDAPGVPIAGLRFDGPHRQAWQDDMPTLPTQAPDGEALAALWAFAMRADPMGRLLVTMGAAARASIATFVPVATALLPVGQSRAGKTISSNFARGFDGPCPPRARADCVFTGTIPGLESSIAPLHDEYVLIDDFHIKATDGPNEIARMGNQLDMLITGSADGNDMRPRSTRTGKRRRESVVTAMLALTGEGLPATTESRVLRAVMLPYTRGEMDTAYLLDGWGEYQRVWWSAGHAVMRWVGERVNDDMSAFRREIEAREAAYKAHLLAALITACPASDREALDTLASGYARPAMGLWLVAQACDADAAQLAETALPVLIRYATLQARAIENGGPGQASRQWIVDAIHALLDEGRGYGLDMRGVALQPEDVAGALSDYGYTGAFPRGTHLFNRDADAGMTYWRTERLNAALADRASHARPAPIPWPWNKETLPGYLVKLGIATPERNADGATGRASPRVHIFDDKGVPKRVRRLAIPDALLIGDDDTPDDEDTSPIGDTKNSGPSGPAVPYSPSSPINPELAIGTALDRSQNESGPSGPAGGDSAPDSATYAPGADTDATPGELWIWGDEDADAAPYPPPAPDRGDAGEPVPIERCAYDISEDGELIPLESEGER